MTFLDPLTTKNTAIRNKKKQDSTIKSLKKQVDFIDSQYSLFNRSKNIVCFSINQDEVLRRFDFLDSPLGVMGFSLNYIRLILSSHQLYDELSFKAENDKNFEINKKRRDKLIYSIVSDMMWGSVSLVEFFWLSFKNSKTMGFWGLRLEVLASLLDLLILTIKYQRAYQDHLKAFEKATPAEKKILAIEWNYTQANSIRELIHSLIGLSALISLTFVNLTSPVSPIMFASSLASNALKVHWKWEKTLLLIEEMKAQKKSAKEIRLEEQKFKNERVKDVNAFILEYAVLPCMLYMILTASLVAVGLCAVVFLALELILTHYQDSQRAKIDRLESCEFDDTANQNTQFAFLGTEFLKGKNESIIFNP